MNREFLKAQGLSDEQIEAIMSENGKDMQKVNALKDKANKADELQKQIDAINEANMSEIDKANKALENANARIAELEKVQLLANRKASIVEKFKIDSKKADEIVLEDGSLDLDKLGVIISEKEEAAKNAAIQSLADSSANPGGGANGSTDNRTEAEKIAENYGNALSAGNKTSADIIGSYIN